MHFVNDIVADRPRVPRSQVFKVLALVPAALGVGGLWAALYARGLAGRPLVPVNDPLLADVLEHATLTTAEATEMPNESHLHAGDAAVAGPSGPRAGAGL